MNWPTERRFTWNKGAQRTLLSCSFCVIWIEPTSVVFADEPFDIVTWKNIGLGFPLVIEVAIWFVVPLLINYWFDSGFCAVDDEPNNLELLVLMLYLVSIWSWFLDLIWRLDSLTLKFMSIKKCIQVEAPIHSEVVLP